MKNNKWLLFVILIGIFIIPSNVLAYYNGSGVSVNGSSGGQCSGWGSNRIYCNYNNNNHKTVMVSLFYFQRNGDGSYTRTELGKELILTSNAANAYLKGVTSPTVIEDPTLDYKNVINILFESVNNEIVDMKEPYKSAMGINNNMFTLPTTDPDLNGYGYRIIIEPMLSVELADNTHKLITVKQAAAGGLTCPANFFKKVGSCGGVYHAVKLYTDKDDVGISRVAEKNNEAQAKAAADAVGSPSQIQTAVANANTGFGYNIVDIPKDWKKHCYKMVTVSNAAVCKNTGKNNIGGFLEIPKEVSCDSKESDETIDKDGRIVKINGCEMSCVEAAQQNFPGNIKHNVEVGTYLIWPTSSKTVSHPTFQNKYSMTYKGIISCKIKKNADKCNSLSNQQIYPFNVEASVSWHDGNKVKTAKVSKSKPKYKRSLSGDVLKLTATVVYSLSDHFNQYISKKDYAVSSNKPNASYVDIGYANLSLDRKAESGTYNLSIKTTNLGARTNFVSSSKNQEYTCKYKTVKFDSPYECPEGTMNPGADLYAAMLNEHITYAEAVDKYCNMDSCICPENSKMAGKNLVGYLSSMSCSDAQNKYCDYDGACLTCPSGTANEGMVLKCPNGDCNGAISTMCEKEIISEDDVCDDADGDSKYCPAPNDDINISACISAGMSYSECVNKLCNGNKKYTCKNTNGVGGKMDITACVQTKVAQGLSVNEAIDACDMVICPLGKTIIYRVIDLANPFPSYDADKKVTQTGLHKGMFNDNLRGRYPGSNWNSETVVKKEILNNRNVDGDSVYTSKPMYVFELNSNTLKTIRKYNKNKKYDDFNLKCKNNNSTACVSSFVHNKAYGLTGGVYSGNLTKDNFYSYDNKATS